MQDTIIISILENEKLDLTQIEKAFDIKPNGTSFGISEYQINNFILNKQEFPNDYAQYLQARAEVYHRIQLIIDFYYQYRECLIKIKLAEGRIEKIQQEPIIKIRESKIELQNLEIEKLQFRTESIKTQVQQKVKEASVFYETYKKHKHFETDTPEQIRQAEEEYWKIKSAYYPELLQRYGLTPSGRIKLPHEEGGLEALIQYIDSQKQIQSKRGVQ